ncbi:hypothetical protein Dimus_001327 [Dionaea muscipula]
MLNADDISEDFPQYSDENVIQIPSGKEETTDIGVCENFWVVSVESPHLEVKDVSGPQNVVGQPLAYALFQPQHNVGDRSPLLETDYRNIILDDLFLVYNYSRLVTA